ncbi:MAG: thiamine pyrophosphate-binding protein [Hydrogeniiclostridium mannosilyticum]
MKASDYIVEYLIGKGITDVFGYPGGMVTHLMDSFSKYQGQIAAHVTYHEQGAAFAACGYAQTSGKVGVAYATSGPGATNLITGICNAFFDSIPTLFITGQVNTFEAKNEMPVRQRGFQETDIVSMVKGVTKYAAKVDNADGLKWQLDFAFAQAQSGRKGPVLLDIPMDILRAEIDADQVSVYEASEIHESTLDESRIAQIREALKQAKRPVILLGNGIKMANAVADARKVIAKLGIPTVSTMISVDIVNESALNYGFIGAYGDRAANFIVAKSDLTSPSVQG